MDLPNGWELAGWDDRGEWQNTEAGGEYPSDDDLADTDRIVISIRDENDEIQYYTIPHGVDGWDGLEDAIDHILGLYE